MAGLFRKDEEDVEEGAPAQGPEAPEENAAQGSEEPGNAPMSDEELMSKGKAPAGKAKEEGEPIDEEDQQKQLVGAALLVAYESKVMDQIVAKFRESEAPVQALAEISVMLMNRAEGEIDGKIDPTVLIGAGADVLGDMAELAGKLQIYDFSEEEINSAFLVAVDQYRAAKDASGQLDNDYYRQEVERLKQADADGTLQKEMPELANVGQYLPKGPPQGGEQEAM